jgi:hypothetical protein
VLQTAGEGTRFTVLSCKERARQKRKGDEYVVEAKSLTALEEDFAKKFQVLVFFWLNQIVDSRHCRAG